MGDSDNSEDDLKLQSEFGQSCSPLGFAVETKSATRKLIPSPTPILVRKDQLLSQLKRRVDSFPCDEMTFTEVSDLISDIFFKRGQSSHLR